MGYAVLPVSLKLAHRLVRLPDSFEVVSAHQNTWNRTLDFTIKSDLIPEVPEGCELERLPALEILVTYQEIDGEIWNKVETKLSWLEHGKYREEKIGG